MDIGRSFADPLSSTVQFTSFDLMRGFGDLLVHRLPYFALPQLTHELTHQWCFNSVVGRAVTYLLFRAQREAVLGDPNGRVRRDAIRAELIQEILLPLSEGIALFAEHDLYPGSVESTARPLLACAPLVAEVTDQKGPFNLYKNLSRKLLAARMRATHRDRKASALLEPLTSRSGPYGIGYIAVKALQLQGARRDSRLLDSDLFAQVIHGYFYEDWNLVAALLTDDSLGNEADGRERLLEYMTHRMRVFADSIRGPAIDDFIERSVNNSGQRHRFECVINGIEHSFWVDEFEGRASGLGQSLLSELMEDALDLAAIHDQRLGTVVAWQTFMNVAAQVVTVASADIAARRLPHHLMLMMNEELPSAALPYAGILPSGWSGTLRVVAALVVEQSRFFILMFDGERVVAEFGFEQLRKAIPESDRMLTMLATPWLDPRQRSQAGLLLREIVQECVGEFDIQNDPALDDDIDSLYFSVLDNMHGQDGAAKSIVSALPSRSLFDLLSGDLDVIEHIAVASLLSASPFRFEPPDVDRATLDAHISEANRRLGPFFGFSPIRINEANELEYSAI